jgi:hypothetical protein
MVLVGMDAYGRFSDVYTRLSVGVINTGEEGVDITPTMMQCKFSKRKNDRYGSFEPLIIERRKDCTSSVAWVEKFLAEAGRTTGPLFCEVVEPSKKNGLSSPGFGSKPMPYMQSLARLRKRLQEVGVSKEDALLYSTHSM